MEVSNVVAILAVCLAELFPEIHQRLSAARPPPSRDRLTSRHQGRRRREPGIKVFLADKRRRQGFGVNTADLVLLLEDIGSFKISAEDKHIAWTLRRQTIGCFPSLGDSPDLVSLQGDQFAATLRRRHVFHLSSCKRWQECEFSRELPLKNKPWVATAPLR